jgi:hypothetical protein
VDFKLVEQEPYMHGTVSISQILRCLLDGR